MLMETLPSVTGIEHYGDRVDSIQCAHVSHHSLVQKTQLILIIIFLLNLSSSTYCLSHAKKASILYIPARCSEGHCHRCIPVIVFVAVSAALLSTAIATSITAVFPTLSWSTSFHKSCLCSLVATCRNWIKPRHSGVNHDVWMVHVPLDGPNGGCHWQCECNDISVNDVIILEIPWFVSGAIGNTLPYGSQIFIPTWNPISSPKQRHPITICDINDGQQHHIIHLGAT